MFVDLIVQILYEENYEAPHGVIFSSFPSLRPS